MKTKAIIFIIFFLLLLVSHCVTAQPSYQTSAINTGIAASVTVNKPSGTLPNDLMVVGLMYEKGSSETITPPVGWALIARTDNSTNSGMATYYKIAGASEPASYSFGLSNGSKWAIGIARISNANTFAPIDVSGGATGMGTSVRSPSINTSGNNRLILCFYTNKKASTYTPDGSTTERYDNPNSAEGLPSNMMASFIMATAGATGNKNATSTDSESWSGQQIAITPSIILPMGLIQFSATTCNNSSVCLTWQTASETNNDYFTIERSKNGINWEQILLVQGAGNSSTVRHYTAKDPLPNRINYYRIKQTDFDGKYSYSQVKTVYIDGLENTKIKTYPNPTNAQIIIEGNPTEIKEVRIYNLLRQDVTSRVKIISNSESRYEIDLSSLTSGIYILKTRTIANKVTLMK